MAKSPFDQAELVRIFREELRAVLAGVREGRKGTMTTPIDDMSIGQATAEILRRVRGIDARLDAQLAKAAAAEEVPAPERRAPSSVDRDTLDRLSRLYGSLRQELTRLHNRLDALEKHVGFDSDEALRKRIEQLERSLDGKDA